MDNRPDNLWFRPEFLKNQRNFPEEERMKYAGQYVAYSWDGSRIVVGDPDEATLYKKIVALGYDLSRVVIDYVDDGKCSHIS
jgi:hypothetical protein